ncbi:uncharacterized protein LOC104934470 [Larimichthys crocea]|uniref:uncharacterized protein LOC104934470 n=1 Tax=Larimichthys crocea TaxID=215358 RepID=UPI000F5F916E|nr:uncharacterized protein LOC104934470 [Larimichthys crocea]
MAPKRGIIFLLIVACAVSAKSFHVMPGSKSDIRDTAKKLMSKCQDQGHPVPQTSLMYTVFNVSDDLPIKDRTHGNSNSLLSAFKNILDSVKDPRSRAHLDDSDTMANMMWNSSNLPSMIQIISNTTDESACYMHAFVAPMCWETLTTQSEDIMDSQDYDKLLWAAKPALQDMPSSKMKLPNKIGGQKVKKMMKMLKEVYDPMPEDQKKKVVKWVKEQITQNYFNCTLRTASNSRLHLAHCKSSLKWLNLEALSMMGPYVTRLAPHDLDSSPKEKLCDYFGSKQFKSAMAMATKINPSLAKRFLQRFQECFTGEEFAENVDKLGTLACHTYDVPDLTAVASRTLLTELENCSSDNPRIKKLKMKLVHSAMSDLSPSEAVNKLGSSVTFLSPKQLSEIPKDVLRKALQNLGSNAQWTQGQLQTLVKNQLGDKKCAKISGTELKTLQSVARGLPSCILEQVSASEILNDTEALKNISKRMKKGQLKAMLQGLRSSADPSELVKKLHGPLLQSISLSTLSTVNFSSVDQVEDKIWSLAQNLL